jgi:hypothetical protein
MPSFQQSTLAYRARNANSVTILIGDQPIGFGQTLAHTFDFGTEGIYGIGTAMPQEIQQLRVAPQITIDSFALTQKGLQVLGYPINLASILSNTQFNIFVTDGTTQQPLFTYVGCVASNFNENIPANRPITDAITFLAMNVLDSTGQSILDSPTTNALQVAAFGSNTAGAANLGNQVVTSA